jgi:Patatin-like phospholipase
MRTNAAGYWIRISMFLALVALVGCSGPIARRPVPSALADVAQIPGMPPGVRAWGDEFSPAFQKSVVDSVAEVNAAYGAHPPTDVLAISGGGSHGAFATGLLHGWSEAGNRPTFRLVTGVSVGAIIAPFAFLGSEYDETS